MPRRMMLVMMWLAGTACAALVATLSVNLVGHRLINTRLTPMARAEVVSSADDAAGRTPSPTVAPDVGETAPGGGSTTAAPAPSIPSSAPPVPAAAPGRASSADGSASSDAATPTTAPRSGPAVAPADAPTTESSRPSTASTTSTVSVAGGEDTAGPAGPEGPGGVSPTTRPPDDAAPPASIDDGGNRNGGASPGGPPTTTVQTTSPPATFRMIGGVTTVACTGATISVSSYTPTAGFHFDGGSLTGNEITVKFRANDGAQSSELRAACVGGRPTVVEIRER